MITNDVKKYIEKSVLCWLATINSNNEPNVSPKEMFAYQDNKTLLIAHIASPNSVRNIQENPNVCVSFIDIFVQKGYKIKGKARLVEKHDADFKMKANYLIDLYTNKLPIQSIIEVTVTTIQPIVAPSYVLFGDTTEQSQIESACRTYKVTPTE